MRVLAGMELGPGDEVLTAPDEHPGLLGPLITLRDRRGVDIRAVPFADLADAVGPRTKLVACSHVSWITGAVRPSGLASLDIPVLLDGAQGVGAIGFDVGSLGCAFYAGSGQKWMCGPIGSGMLWVAPEWQRARGAGRRDLREPRERRRRPRRRAASRRPPLRLAGHRPRDHRRRARRPRRPRRVRLARGLRARDLARRSARRRASQDGGPDRRAARRDHARVLRGRRPRGDPRPPRRGRRHRPPPAGDVVRARLGRARGTTRATSSGCSPRSEGGRATPRERRRRGCGGPRAAR